MNDIFEYKNFLNYPDEIRNYGLNLEAKSYKADKQTIWSGYRAKLNNIEVVGEIVKKIEHVSKRKIQNIDPVFHFNPECSKQGVPHVDGYRSNGFAGVVYLNKIFSKNSGTTIYENIPTIQQNRNKFDFIDIPIVNFRDKVEIMYNPNISADNVYKNIYSEELTKVKQNFLTEIVSFEFEYNKMICYPEYVLHSPNFYFGEEKETSRMTIAFHGVFFAK